MGLDSGIWKRGLTGPCVTALFSVKYNRSLSCSRVTLLSQKQCETFYPGVITNNMICAEPDGNQDSCQVRTDQQASPSPGWGGGGVGRKTLKELYLLSLPSFLPNLQSSLLFTPFLNPLLQSIFHPANPYLLILLSLLMLDEPVLAANPSHLHCHLPTCQHHLCLYPLTTPTSNIFPAPAQRLLHPNPTVVLQAVAALTSWYLLPPIPRVTPVAPWCVTTPCMASSHGAFTHVVLPSTQLSTQMSANTPPGSEEPFVPNDRLLTPFILTPSVCPSPPFMPAHTSKNVPSSLTPCPPLFSAHKCSNLGK